MFMGAVGHDALPFSLMEIDPWGDSLFFKAHGVEAFMSVPLFCHPMCGKETCRFQSPYLVPGIELTHPPDRRV